MTVHNKIYEAIFYQKPDSEKTDKQVIQKKIDEELLSKYTLEQLANPTEEISKEIESIASQLVLDKMFKKPVWFRISESLGKYYISIFYDNEYNRANGEDL